MDSGLAEILANDDGQELVVVDYLVYHSGVISLYL